MLLFFLQGINYILSYLINYSSESKIIISLFTNYAFQPPINSKSNQTRFGNSAPSLLRGIRDAQFPIFS